MGGPDFFLNDMGGLEIHIVLKGRVSNILPAKGHESRFRGCYYF